MVLKPVASMSKALRERKQQKMTKESLEVSDDLSKWCWAPVVIWFIDWTKTTFDFYLFIYLFIYFFFFLQDRRNDDIVTKDEMINVFSQTVNLEIWIFKIRIKFWTRATRTRQVRPIGEMDGYNWILGQYGPTEKVSSLIKEIIKNKKKNIKPDEGVRKQPGSPIGHQECQRGDRLGQSSTCPR